MGCAVEVRDRPELFRVVERIDKGFETIGLEPWTTAAAAVTPVTFGSAVAAPGPGVKR